MNLKYVNSFLRSEEQDSTDVVLLSFFLLLPLSAALPHAHFFVAVLVLFLLAFGLLRCGKAWMRPLWEGTRGTCVRIFLLFLALSLSGAVLSLSRAPSVLSVCLRLSFFLPMLFSQRTERMRRTLALLGGGMGVLAPLELLLGLGKVGYTDVRLAPMLCRAAGVFGNPNVLALFLLPCTLFALNAALFEKRRRWLYLLAFSGGAAGIAASYSRGAMLALLCASFLLLARRLGFSRLLFASFSLLPLASLFLPEALLMRLFSVLSPDSSVLYRFSLWRSVFRLPPSALLFGAGEGRATMLSLLFPVMASGLSGIEHTHSLFLHILLADGVLGLILFLAMCVLSLGRRGDRGAKAAMLSLLIFGIFDDPLYSGQTEVIFWLSFGLI